MLMYEKCECLFRHAQDVCLWLVCILWQFSMYLLGFGIGTMLANFHV